MLWTMYPAFIATAVSIIGLTRIAARRYNHDPPCSLSELAASERSLLKHFRNILIFCGILFAISVFGYIAPRVSHGGAVAVFGGLMIGGELMASLLPARNKTMILHNMMAQIMAIGMLGLAILFCISLEDIFLRVEIALLFGMFVLAILTYVDRRRYLMYESAFIFSSHFSILVATLAIGWSA